MLAGLTSGTWPKPTATPSGNAAPSAGRRRRRSGARGCLPRRAPARFARALPQGRHPRQAAPHSGSRRRAHGLERGVPGAARTAQQPGGALREPRASMRRRAGSWRWQCAPPPTTPSLTRTWATSTPRSLPRPTKKRYASTRRATSRAPGWRRSVNCSQWGQWLLRRWLPPPPRPKRRQLPHNPRSRESRARHRRPRQTSRRRTAATAPPPSATRAVLSTVEDWARAWSSKDVEQVSVLLREGLPHAEGRTARELGSGPARAAHHATHHRGRGGRPQRDGHRSQPCCRCVQTELSRGRVSLFRA